MPLQSSGPLSLLEISNEFQRARNLAAHYGATQGIPTSGPISIAQFYGKSNGPPPGQIVIETLGTSTWTVPALVTSICVVCVAPGGNYSYQSSVIVNSVTVCRAYNGARIGDGGGDGGQAGGTMYDAFNYPYGYSGGGGAGGYAGNGGNGGGGSYNVSAGQGGGGAGGWPGGQFDSGYRHGGGVGLLGQGPSGNTVPSKSGEPGSYGVGTKYGAGFGTYAGPGTRGGALSYKNNIAVTPGQVITLFIDDSGATGGIGGIRIIWGAGRAFPSTNTHDM